MKKIIPQFGDKADKIFKSITADNGSEFATLTDTITFAYVYFTHTYSSFERGTNEKQKSLLSRFFSKNKSLENLSDQAIKAAQDVSILFQEKYLIILVLMTISNALLTLYKLSNLILQFTS